MKTLGRWLLLCVLVGIVAALIVWRRPLWVERQGTHLELFFARVQSNYVLTPAGRVHYYEAESRVVGGGIPLVLVHGLADRDESWAPMLKAMRRAGFHVYAPDLLGYGRSPKSPTGDYSIAAQEQFVREFIQALGLQRTDLGGWSMGGWVAMRVALDHPDLVNRLVVYDSVGLKMDLPTPGLFAPDDPDQVQRLLATLEPEMKRMPNWVAEDLVRQNKKIRGVVSRSLASMETGRDLVDDRLPSLPMPFLIVWGSLDKLTPLSLGQTMHALDPRSELDVVEGCGHLAPLVCAPKVASATADFLKTNPAPEGGVRTLAHMH